MPKKEELSGLKGDKKSKDLKKKEGVSGVPEIKPALEQGGYIDLDSEKDSRRKFPSRRNYHGGYNDEPDN